MYNFIDLHNHSLCHIDDGARNHKMMENMLDIAYKDGIKAICFTPHFKAHYFDSTSELEQYSKAISISFNDAVRYVKEKEYDISLFLGNEVMYHNDICENISKGFCNKLPNSSYILVEFTPTVSEFDLKHALTKLLRKGYRPILAHFERYECIVKKLSLLSELKDLGVIIQLNASSILKFKLGKTSKAVKFSLKKHLVDIVATDAHDDKVFTPILSKAFIKTIKKYGQEYANKIFHDNQALIIGNVYTSQGA